MVYFDIFINSITLDRTIKGRPDEQVFTLTSFICSCGRGRKFEHAQNVVQLVGRLVG